MKIKCDYCGNTYEDTLHQCPDCGAPNQSHKNEKGPKTIEELKQWYKDRNLPDPEVTRFFIGVDYKKPKAFGIYQDENGEFVVYKNKADGSRAVRYRGKDEEYAVNELLQRLKDEIVHQKANSGAFSNGSTKRSAKSSGGSFRFFKSLTLMFIIMLVVGILANFMGNSHKGYYQYDGDIYYTISNDWYQYDDGWHEVSSAAPGPQAIASDYDEYFISRTWNTSLDATNWDNSSYYDRYHSDSDDSDYDWGNDDSWDSDGTDWDSDW